MALNKAKAKQLELASLAQAQWFAGYFNRQYARKLAELESKANAT